MQLKCYCIIHQESFRSTNMNFSPIINSLVHFINKTISLLLNQNTFQNFLSLLRLMNYLLLSNLVAKRRQSNEILEAKYEQSHDFERKQCTCGDADYSDSTISSAMCHFSHILVTILITSIYKGEVTLPTATSISKHGKISLKKSLIL